MVDACSGDDHDGAKVRVFLRKFVPLGRTVEAKVWKKQNGAGVPRRSFRGCRVPIGLRIKSEAGRPIVRRPVPFSCAGLPLRKWRFGRGAAGIYLAHSFLVVFLIPYCILPSCGQILPAAPRLPILGHQTRRSKSLRPRSFLCLRVNESADEFDLSLMFQTVCQICLPRLMQDFFISPICWFTAPSTYFFS